jgi:prepilin-type N-terminal cleavage/methylation domain-containing protein
MQNPHKKHIRGFSLIELIIYIALLSTLSLAVASAFLSFNRGRGQVTARSEVNTNLRFAIEKITQDLNEASAVLVPSTPGLATTTLSINTGGVNVVYCVISAQIRRGTGGVCDASSETITSSAVSVATSTFTRMENTNTVLNQTISGIIIDIGIRYNGTNPDTRYDAAMRSTVNLK